MGGLQWYKLYNGIFLKLFLDFHHSSYFLLKIMLNTDLNLLPNRCHVARNISRKGDILTIIIPPFPPPSLRFRIQSAHIQSQSKMKTAKLGRPCSAVVTIILRDSFAATTPPITADRLAWASRTRITSHISQTVVVLSTRTMMPCKQSQ